MAQLTSRELRAQKAKQKPKKDEQVEAAVAAGEAHSAAVEQAASDAAAEAVAAAIGNSGESLDEIAKTAQQLDRFLRDVKERGLEDALAKHGIVFGVDMAVPGADHTAYDDSGLAEQDKFNTPQAKEARRHAERLARGEQ